MWTGVALAEYWEETEPQRSGPVPGDVLRGLDDELAAIRDRTGLADTAEALHAVLESLSAG